MKLLSSRDVLPIKRQRHLIAVREACCLPMQGRKE